MLKRFINYLCRSLSVRIFLVTVFILTAACSVTYAFIAWATPISYNSITSSELEEQLAVLLPKLSDLEIDKVQPVLEKATQKIGIEFAIFDQTGNIVAATGSQAESVALQKSGDDSSDTDSMDDMVTLKEGSYFTEEISQSDAEKDDEDTAVAEQLKEDSPDGTWINNGTYLAGADSALISTTVVQDIVFKGSDEIYTIEAVSTMAKTNQTIEALKDVLPFLIPVVAVISLLGALFYSGFITRPVVRLSKISQKMADLKFDWKCPDKRKDEIGILGGNLNVMSERLSGALSELKSANDALQEDIKRERETERQRMTFFYAASHELKTPITVLKGQLSGMLAGVDIYQNRDKYLARSLSVAGRMERLVQEMLSVTRMENAGFSIRQESVDLSRLLCMQLEQAADHVKLRGQQLVTGIASGITVRGDEALLNRAVCSLLANAVSYSPEQETITVILAEEAGRPVLTIENSGMQIPEDALPHLFEAFYRVEASRNRETGGSGLGLYLVKMILDRHQAECRIENSKDSVRVTASFSMKTP